MFCSEAALSLGIWKLSGRAQEQPFAGPTAFVCAQEEFSLGTQETEGPTPSLLPALPALLNRGRGCDLGGSPGDTAPAQPLISMPTTLLLVPPSAV